MADYDIVMPALDSLNIGVGLTRAELTDPPVPIGPADADKLPPIVIFPLFENALTASSLFRTTTNSDMSC